jgi:ppGpp synthetase/RelA/SpoT-type nucleotidyltranferase
MIVQAMLEIFMEIPQVRKVLEQNWSRVQKEIQARIAGDEPKAIEITPEPDNG